MHFLCKQVNIRITLQELGAVDNALASQVGRQDGAREFGFTNNA
jgi:hypothetical protein